MDKLDKAICVMFYYIILNKLLLLIYSCSCHGCWSFYCFGDSRKKQVFKSACCHQGRAEMCRSEYHLPWEHTEGSCVGEKSNSLKKAPEILSGTISIETSPRETGSRHLPLHAQTLVSCGMWYHQERLSFISGSWPTTPSTVLQVCSFLV